MRAVILAGGKGRRLLPYTTVFPKPLMPIGDMPILEVVLRQLKRHGFDRITMAVGHLSELLRAFFNDGKRFGLDIDYSMEENPLGTAGPLSLISGLDEPFIVMNGDILTDLDYSNLFRHHRESGGIATIATHERSVKIDYGVLESAADGIIHGYTEKPSIQYRVSMGVYVFDPKVLVHIPRDAYLDFPELVKTLIRNGEKVFSYPFEGNWLDIGRPDDYEQAIMEFENNKERYLPGGTG